MKKMIVFTLKWLAKSIIDKYKPKIVGITGSVGKTSAKEASYCVLSSKFRVGRSLKNYNNEFGMPLSIIGVESPGRSILGWIAVFYRAIGLLIVRDREYPEILVLEMGVDKAGDMDYLNSIVKCDVGVLTGVGEAHLENFGTVENIRKEKVKLLRNINKNGLAIINFDNKPARESIIDLNVRTISYGFTEGAGIIASNFLFKFEEVKNQESLSGITFKVRYGGSMVPVVLPRVIGAGAVYAALAAIAVGSAFKINLVESAAALKNFISPKGRMKLISGIKRSILIDDTYNSSPQSSLTAVDFIRRAETGRHWRKIAVFGDMLELGDYTEKGHREVGEAIAVAKFDLLVTVGELARHIGHGAIEAGMDKEKIFNFSRNDEAGRFVQDRLEEEDLVLIKGSQGARMEKVVKELMADPLKAPELLVRQGSEWADK